MTEVAALRQRLRTARAGVIAGLAGLADADLERPWPWRGGEADVRYALLRIADHELEHTLQVAQTLAALGWRPTEAQRILGLAEMSQGMLLGELVGVPDELLDRAPAPGEWPLRTVLGHMIVTERRYWRRTEWHVAEARAGRPTTAAPPDGVVEPLQQAAKYEHGTLADLTERLASVREEALGALVACTDEDLVAPTNWAGFDVNVRFRLHRFAAHEREHTVQVAKTLRAVGFEPTEAQRLLGQAQATRGQMLALLVGVPDELVARRPAPEAWSVVETLAHLMEVEEGRLTSVPAALAK